MTDVAIVIPTLNRESLLGGAIASALRCEPRPKELVVVDCGSTDGTRDVVHSFGNKVQLIDGSFPNAAGARNAGLAATHSPYVGFLDSDDETLPCKTGGLSAVLDRSGEAALVHGTLDAIDEEGERLPAATAQLARDKEIALTVGTTFEALANFCSLYTSATLMRREALVQIGGFDETLDAYEDWDLYLRLAVGWRLDYADCEAAKYRVWPGNVAWDRTARGVIEVAEKHLAILPPISEDISKSAAFGLLRRVASSNYTLVQLPEARSAAWAAFRIDPMRGIADKEIRRALARSWLPKRLLEPRRAARSL